MAIPNMARSIGRASRAVANAAANDLGRLQIDTSALSQLNEKFQAFFKSIDAGLASIQRNVARFVELSNPAAVIQFNLALRDMQGVIGQILTPVMQNATRLVRMFGDALINLSPAAKAGIAALAALTVGLTVATVSMMALNAAINLATAGIPMLTGAIVGLATASGLLTGFGDKIKPMMEQISGLMDRVFSTIIESIKPLLSIAESLMPVIATVINSLVALSQIALQPLLIPVKLLAAVLEGLKPLIDLVSQAINQFTNFLLTLFGVQQQNTTNRSSVGAAMRNSQIGSIESFIQSQTAKSYQGATGPSGQTQIISQMGVITGFLKEIRDFIKAISEWLSNKLEYFMNQILRLYNYITNLGMP